VYGMGPGTAKGIVFLSVEDETGIANAAVMPDVFDANRLLIISNRWLLVEGPIQNVDKLIHVRAKRIVPIAMALHTSAARRPALVAIRELRSVRCFRSGFGIPVSKPCVETATPCSTECLRRTGPERGDRLFRAQRYHRIDVRSAASRKPAGQKGCGQNRYRG
jgi:hypothetical protein